jgi:CheY-like chemotaxis protein
VSAKENEPRPIVLVVEDNDRARRLRVEAFNQALCTPIGVRSHDDAVRELRAAPAVDLVLTDIHLAPPAEDKSGVALARYIKQTYRDMPVAGYSAVFVDEDLGSDKDVFDVIWTKGDVDFKHFEKIIEYCRERALDHRQRRREEAFEAHDLLRRRHETTHPDVELMRELRPGAGAAAPVEEALSEAGYRLKLVEADVNGLAKPIIVWLLEVDDGVEAEVYGQPALYADGANDEEAIASLVDLMRLYAAELGPDAPEAIGPALSLTDFLRRVVADENEA